MSEYQNFENLLRRVVTTPKSIVDKRAEEEANVKEWRAKHDLPQKRHRIPKVEAEQK